jgi:hypothetical protein
MSNLGTIVHYVDEDTRFHQIEKAAVIIEEFNSYVDLYLFPMQSQHIGEVISGLQYSKEPIIDTWHFIND